ncbi:MAG: hypothetical protein RBR93_12665 [Aliarcobacter butzleri]|nr:hypothetical protein [Aliarcobacter butzleri]
MENDFMNRVKHTLKESFKGLDDDTKNKEFARLFDECENAKAKLKQIRDYCEKQLKKQILEKREFDETWESMEDILSILVEE